MNTTTTQQGNTMIYPSTIVCNIYCKKCKNVLPPHTVERHLSMDENDPIYKCPHKKQQKTIKKQSKNAQKTIKKQ